jgi:hypothetical protein
MLGGHFGRGTGTTANAMMPTPKPIALLSPKLGPRESGESDLVSTPTVAR